MSKSKFLDPQLVSKHLSVDKLLTYHKFENDSGFTLVELLAVLAIASVLIAALTGTVGIALNSWRHSFERSELIYQSNFAMERMVEAVRQTRRLMIPIPDNPATLYNESQRSVLAATISPYIDSDGDTFADADDDHDGFIDEDIPPDNTNDEQPGIFGIDDDGDGAIDEGNVIDNDEDSNPVDDWIDGIDNDGDLAIDEDIPRKNGQNSAGVSLFDNDGDSQKGEDWLNPVVFYVDGSGAALIERTPQPNQNGSSTDIHTIAEAAVISLTVVRLPMNAGDRSELVTITLTLTGEFGETVTLQNTVRVGGGA